MSSSNRDEMIRNLKEIVVPALRQLNFKGSFPHFRRMTEERINLLTFQFDRYGGGFVMEVANAKNEPFKMSAQVIEPNRLTCHMVSKRMRIQPIMHENGDSSTDDWFRYDKKHLFGLGDIYKKVCKDVLSKLDIADDYWKNGELNNDRKSRANKVFAIARFPCFADTLVQWKFSTKTFAIATLGTL